MGITVHYRGTLADLDRVEDFEDRVLDLVLDLNGQARVWRSASESDPSRIVRGLIVNLEPGQEPVSLLISPEGWLIAPFQLAESEEGKLTEPPWCFCKTQFGTVEGHVAVVELLAAIRREFIPNLEVHDEAEYWETRDVDTLARKKQFLDRAISVFKSELEQHGLTREAAEDREILLKRIERIAAKVQRIIGRPSEHPPFHIDDDEFSSNRDAAATEAEYDEFYKHTERRKEQLHRAIEERLQRGEDHRSAFDNAMRDIGLSVPGDLDWQIGDEDEDDTVEEDADFDRLDDDESEWPENLFESSEATDDSAENSFDDENETPWPDERDEHPLLSRARQLWLEFHQQFKDASMERADKSHESHLETLFHGLGELNGGLAQALSRDFDDEDDDSDREFTKLDDIRFGLTVTQLKRALRGLAFARGALCNLRSLVSQPDLDRFHETINRLNQDLTVELQRLRERFEGEP